MSKCHDVRVNYSSVPLVVNVCLSGVYVYVYGVNAMLRNTHGTSEVLREVTYASWTTIFPLIAQAHLHTAEYSSILAQK